MTSRSKKIGLGACLLALVVPIGCKKATTTSSPTAPPSSPSETASHMASASPASPKPTPLSNGHLADFRGTIDASANPVVTVEMGDNFFKPTVISGTPGQALTINLSNDGVSIHNFSLTAQSINQDVQAGQKASVKVKIPASGAVEFFCTYHQALNMRGELVAK